MMHAMILLAVVALGLVSEGRAQIVQEGQCETLTLMSSFTLNTFATGTWYEIGRTGTDSAQCSNQAWTISEAGAISLVHTSVVDNFLQTVTGTATHTTETARFTLQLPAESAGTDFWILGTDYNNWAIAINCVNTATTSRTLNVWQLGRAANSYENSVTLQAANSALATINVNVAQLESISHSTDACTQLPIIQPGEPVILSGQCNNDNINVVTNFDVAGFLGTWHETSSYYSANAVGTCARADYSTEEGTGVVDVVNSQILNQQLDQITGTATVIGNDQSGRLSVVLNVQGVQITQELLIIATNYGGYAVSYSCVNLANNQRQVNAWILSRSRTMSAEDQTLVNQAIASLVDLNNAYFQNTDQSDTGCFYYPTFQPGVPVIFPGQCDTTIAAVAEFQLSELTGTWYEVEAYPKEEQTGSCVNHVFATGTTATTLNLVSNQVVNQEAIAANGNVVIDTNDGTGRLLLTLNTGGQVIQIPYWILSTDYQTYALAYSCMNIDDDSRAVNSWKLSRTQTLSNTANTQINTAMAAVSVLDQRYFESVDQSEDGCFYFPVLQPGVPVDFPGQCDPNIAVQANFDPVQYMGLWHDIQSYPSTFQDGTCGNAYYTLSGGVVDVYNTQVINEQLDTINGTAVIPDAAQPAKLLVTFPIAGTDQFITTDYWILETDYNTYSLVYSCFNIPGTNQRRVSAWKLGRFKTLTADADAAIEAAMSNVQVLDNRYFVPTDQSASGCFYFPEAQEGVPVVFPGQCDTTIAAQPQFNLQDFVGTWHEIEAYPKEQQAGTCINHAFSTVTGNTLTLNLVSNQVVDQMDTAASGSVTLDSADGSGRLWLTITTNGQVIEIPFWILTTDYGNYALAYSCMNLNEDYRAVNSWKLSRTQTLSNTANTQINTAMAAVPVLDQRYFESVDQSEDGCFYFPVLQPGVPVDFPGQCDPNIAVQANFDPVQYMGLWHDIQSYPSTFQDGTCGNAYYTLSGGVVDVYNTQVINEQLDTINGTAVIPDAAQPAKLLVTFPIAGTDQFITTDYWILETDYNTYSLVYSCFNIPGTNQRRVSAWKLGRSKTLTADADAAIEAAMSNVQVLDNRYFVPTDQSASGCFYFPEAQEGVPVVFPGQCDTTIAAQPQFNLQDFVGTWHEIEAYPKEQQAGTCINHAFSTVTGNTLTLNLVSNQVVDQMDTAASGSVTLESTDGSGRLWLTITTNGQVIEIPFWILTTDYVNYALAYSCMNLNEDYRAVQSWKLSRTQTLPEVGVTAINNAIANVQVLNQQYLETVDQSPTGCRSYPDIPAGDPIILEGQCGTVTPVLNFQSDDYIGTWYEAARFASARQTGSCAAKQFALAADNTFTLTQTIIYNEMQTVVSGTATLAADGTGTITAFLSDGADLTYQTTIYILDTDYNDFALLYSCENIGTTNKQIFSWKLSRSQGSLSQAANDRISQVVASNDDLLERYYQTTGQTVNDCFHYPEYTDTPEAIILLGTCPTVSGVANFDPTEYMGNWYDVGRYPIDSQFGSCPTAEYTLVDGVITIRNTMVVNDALRVQDGIGRLSNTGAGLIQATFVDENGEESVAQYFILGTDYTSYSLVYSCRNLGDGNRQVTSWKLSRTPTLTADANTAINTIISNTQGLRESYYQSQTHTDQACFYVPEPVPGQSVLFRGGCEEVTGMQGFTPDQYQGWWHEIERYPTDESRGECTSIDFRQGATANAVDAVEVGVYNNIGNETAGTAVINADASIVITRDGVSTRWIVLGTDYNSYSLLYSCEEVTTSWGLHRRVWSAKHSKARSLTAAANTAMNPLIEGNPVLHAQFYEVVSQTDSTCFHYREAGNEDVILPGQCDSNIPVQADFDISEFAGVWYQIERYPYPQVSNEGTCIGARYTVDNDGVAIQNWEVVDGVLNTIEGRATADGASLEVTLPAQDGEGTVTTVIQILLTDYQNYALAYTCTNINNFQRSVGAFKLSRNRSLTNVGQFAIQIYMASREEFHQPYFISVSHHDECQEPSSAFLAKSSMIAILVCTILQSIL